MALNKKTIQGISPWMGLFLLLPVPASQVRSNPVARPVQVSV
jgi:hypothetical protein